jgi:hypothetical protein
VNRGVLKPIFFLVVKDEAVLVQEGHNWGLPSRAPQEIDNDVKEPVLQGGVSGPRNLTFSDSGWDDAIIKVL